MKLLCSKHVKHQNSITGVVAVSLLFTFNLIHIVKWISKINEVWIKFFENSRIWFIKLFGSIVSHMERINTKNETQHIVSIQSVHKQWSLAYLCKENLTLFKRNRSIDSPLTTHWYLFFDFYLVVKKLMITKKFWKLRTSPGITNHELLSRTFYAVSQEVDASIKAGFLIIFRHALVEFDGWKPSIQ